jgi:hypothetical protein
LRLLRLLLLAWAGAGPSDGRASVGTNVGSGRPLLLRRLLLLLRLLRLLLVLLLLLCSRSSSAGGGRDRRFLAARTGPLGASWDRHGQQRHDCEVRVVGARCIRRGAFRGSCHSRGRRTGRHGGRGSRGSSGGDGRRHSEAALKGGGEANVARSRSNGGGRGRNGDSGGSGRCGSRRGSRRADSRGGGCGRLGRGSDGGSGGRRGGGRSLCLLLFLDHVSHRLGDRFRWGSRV